MLDNLLVNIKIAEKELAIAIQSLKKNEEMIDDYLKNNPSNKIYTFSEFKDTCIIHVQDGYIVFHQGNYSLTQKAAPDRIESAKRTMYSIYLEKMAWSK